MGVAIKNDGRFVREQADGGSRLGRRDVEVPIQLWSHHEGWIPGVLRNLSIGGMFVATPLSLPLGASVLARFSGGDGGEPDDVEARVSWSRRAGTDEAAPPGLGLQFVGPMVRAAIFVRLLLRSRLPDRG